MSTSQSIMRTEASPLEAPEIVNFQNPQSNVKVSAAAYKVMQGYRAAVIGRFFQTLVVSVPVAV